MIIRALTRTKPEAVNCNPQRTDCRMVCCRKDPIAVNVGDLKRISDHTHLSMAEIWHEHGGFTIGKTKTKLTGMNQMGLALANPCSYLSEDDKCRIHDSKPNTCVMFPWFSLEYVSRRRTIRDFPCAAGFILDKAKVEAVQRVHNVFQSETQLDFDLFWPQAERLLAANLSGETRTAILDQTKALITRKLETLPADLLAGIEDTTETLNGVRNLL